MNRDLRETAPFDVCTQDLENAVKVHQSTVTSLNTSGGQIIGQSSAPDSSLLTEKLDLLNKRWRSVCTEVADRKERSVADRWRQLTATKTRKR